jgi:hypothetical protein
MKTTVMLIFTLLGTSVAEAQQFDCAHVVQINRGTHCNAPDSIEAIVVNRCEDQIRGYVHFQKKSGHWTNSPAGLVNSGYQAEVWACNATGAYEFRYNAGNNPDYPSQRQRKTSQRSVR